jgi:hypothetical protein
MEELRENEQEAEERPEHGANEREQEVKERREKETKERQELETEEQEQEAKERDQTVKEQQETYIYSRKATEERRDALISTRETPVGRDRLSFRLIQPKCTGRQEIGRNTLQQRG